MLRLVIPILLGAAFVTVGVVLLSPVISAEIHKEYSKSFDRNFKVNPIVEHKLLKIDAETYRQVVGMTTIVCGILILLGPHVLVQFSYVIMTFVLVVDLYCHIKLDHKARQLGPTMSLLFVTMMQLFGSKTVVHVKTE